MREEHEVGRQHQAGKSEQGSALDRQIAVAQAHMVVLDNNVLLPGERDNSEPFPANVGELLIGQPCHASLCCI